MNNTENPAPTSSAHLDEGCAVLPRSCDHHPEEEYDAKGFGRVCHAGKFEFVDPRWEARF